MGNPIPTVVLTISIIFVILVSLIGFGGKDTFVPVSIPFGMQFNPSGGPELHVWANTPLPAYIHVVLSNISKKEEDGTIAMGVDLFELFPTGEGVNSGGAVATFTMKLIPASDVPEFNTTMVMDPMVWRRQPDVGNFEQLIYLTSSFMLKNWGVISWGIIIKAIVCLLIGILLFMRERKAANDVLPIASTNTQHE